MVAEHGEEDIEVCGCGMLVEVFALERLSWLAHLVGQAVVDGLDLTNGDWQLGRSEGFLVVRVQLRHVVKKRDKSVRSALAWADLVFLDSVHDKLELDDRSWLAVDRLDRFLRQQVLDLLVDHLFGLPGLHHAVVFEEGLKGFGARLLGFRDSRFSRV